MEEKQAYSLYDIPPKKSQGHIRLLRHACSTRMTEYSSTHSVLYVKGQKCRHTDKSYRMDFFFPFVV